MTLRSGAKNKKSKRAILSSFSAVKKDPNAISTKTVIHPPKHTHAFYAFLKQFSPVSNKIYANKLLSNTKLKSTHKKYVTVHKNVCLRHWIMKYI